MYMNTKIVPFPHAGILTFLMLCLTLITAQGIAQAATSDDIALLDRSSKAFVNVVKLAKPAVVHIRVEKTTTRNSSRGLRPEDMFNHPFLINFSDHNSVNSNLSHKNSPNVARALDLSSAKTVSS
jgi:serine protease Do